MLPRCPSLRAMFVQMRLLNLFFLPARQGPVLFICLLWWCLLENASSTLVIGPCVFFCCYVQLTRGQVMHGSANCKIHPSRFRLDACNHQHCIGQRFTSVTGCMYTVAHPGMQQIIKKHSTKQPWLCTERVFCFLCVDKTSGKLSWAITMATTPGQLSLLQETVIVLLVLPLLITG